MSFPLKYRVPVLLFIVIAFSLTQWQSLAAEDVFHVVKGVVKSVDKESKTMVVKTGDGTEHTIKWTDKTTVKGGKDAGEGIEEGAKVSVKYTEKAGEKTATGVKVAGKSTAKAMSN